jgi:hypothetical protein
MLSLFPSVSRTEELESVPDGARTIEDFSPLRPPIHRSVSDHGRRDGFSCARRSNEKSKNRDKRNGTTTVEIFVDLWRHWLWAARAHPQR